MTDFSNSIGISHPHTNFPGARVIDTEGRPGRIISVEQNNENPTVTVQPEHGPEMVLPLSLLSQRAENEYDLSFSFASVTDHGTQPEQLVIPVVQEQLQVDKRLVETGKGVRVRKRVSEREQVVDQPLLQDELVVEHVPVGQMLADATIPTARYEGDTLVVPILEEVLVVEKQVRLKEEVRITRRKREIHAPQTVSLRSEEVSVEHFGEQNGSSHPAGIPPTFNQIKSEPGKSVG